MAFGTAIGQSPNPEPKIISLAITADETLVDIASRAAKGCKFQILGLSPLAVNPVYSNVAEFAQSLPISSTDAEKIFAARPDLVIAAPFNSPELVKQLRSLKVRVEVLNGMNRLSDIRSNLASIGQWIGCPDEAKLLADAMEQKLSASKLSKAQTILAWNESLTLPGKDTIFDDVLMAIGASNSLGPLATFGWAPVNAETLSQLRPDWILVSEHTNQHSADSLRKHPCCRQMQAVKKGQVMVLPERLLSAASHYVGDLSVAIHSQVTR